MCMYHEGKRKHSKTKTTETCINGLTLDQEPRQDARLLPPPPPIGTHARVASAQLLTPRAASPRSGSGPYSDRLHRPWRPQLRVCERDFGSTEHGSLLSCCCVAAAVVADVMIPFSTVQTNQQWCTVVVTMKIYLAAAAQAAER